LSISSAVIELRIALSSSGCGILNIPTALTANAGKWNVASIGWTTAVVWVRYDHHLHIYRAFVAPPSFFGI
jgi:hypothetical protein